MIEKRYELEDLTKISEMWNSKLEHVIKEIPETWIDCINDLSKQKERFIGPDQ